MIKLTSLHNGLIIFLILLFSFAIFGLQPLAMNNVIYYPYIEKLQHPELFPNDILFDALKFHPSYFYPLIVFMANTSGLTTAAILSLLGWIVFLILAGVCFFFCQWLFNNKTVSILFLIVLMGSKYSFGGEAIAINLKQVTQTTLIMPLALWIIYLFLNNKLYWAFFLMGLLANMQPVFGFYLFLIFILAQIIRIKETGFPGKTLKSFLIQFSLVILGSLPLIYFFIHNHLLTILNNQQPASSLSWFELIKLRIPTHVLPSQWGLLTWASGLFLGILFIIGVIAKAKNKEFNMKDKKIIYCMTTFVVIFFLGLLWNEIIPMPLFMKLEIFRSFVFYNFFCVLYGVYLTYYLLRQKKLWQKLTGCLLGVFLFLPTSLFSSSDISRSTIIGLILLLLSFMILVILTHKKILHVSKALLLTKLLIIVFLLGASFFRLYKNYQYWGAFSFDNSDSREWQDIQKWAKQHTKITSMFIVPPNQYGFRVYSERPIVGDYKDGASPLFHPYLYNEWWQRMIDLQVNENTVKGDFVTNYKEIKDEKIINNLAQKYSAEYLVSSYFDLPYPIAYQNKKYVLYKLVSL